ncbi:MAG: 3-deoxy-7-phosphoheptulonate synthase [bacterium]
MIVIMKPQATQKDIDNIVKKINSLGLKAHTLPGTERSIIGAIGDTNAKNSLKTLSTQPGVDNIYPITKPYKLAARSTKHEDSIVTINNIPVGGKHFVVVAGPCSVENKHQIISTAEHIKSQGAALLRGGAYKPRTSPYSFQGLEEEGLKLLAESKKKTGLGIVTELLSAHTTELVDKYTDLIQIGARNMQNFALLKEVGKLKTPVLIKRGLSATLDELLMSAEYVLAGGNYNVILCERGIRTFEKAYRNTLDLNAIPKLKELTHLPIVVDPSHGTGNVKLITPMAKAAIAAGADGLLIEVHPKPEEAYSDGEQSLTFAQFSDLMAAIKPYVELAGKELVVVAK